MRFAILIFFLVITQPTVAQNTKPIIPLKIEAKKEAPLKVGIIGLSHSHVHLLLGRSSSHTDIEIVGIVEPNIDMAQRYAKQYGYAMEKVYPTMEAMTNAVKLEAVTAFGSIYEHLAVVEHFAPLGVHIMVEKPLAVSVKHAKKMQKLATKHNIHLLTNYETTWYATNHKAYEMIYNRAIGDMRRIVVQDGHKGPKEIGVNQEFLEWLTDPISNGGGAIIDFGCYGANLVTWLKKGEKPLTITAVTQTNKPSIYPKVDDEATIILQYPKMQAVLQPSWNWPFSRKDIEIYGETGYIINENSKEIKYKLNAHKPEEKSYPKPRPAPYNDPFSFFKAIVRGEIKESPYSLSSLENNMIVVEILELAKKSAKSGKTLKFSK